MTSTKTIRVDEELHTKLKMEAARLKMDIQEFVQAHLTVVLQNAEAVRRRNEKDHNPDA